MLLSLPPACKSPQCCKTHCSNAPSPPFTTKKLQQLLLNLCIAIIIFIECDDEEVQKIVEIQKVIKLQFGVPPAFKLRSRKYWKFITDSIHVLKDFPRLNSDISATRTYRQTKRSKELPFMEVLQHYGFGHLLSRLHSDSTTTLSCMEIKICTQT